MNHRRYFSAIKSLMFKPKTSHCEFQPLSPSPGFGSLMAIFWDVTECNNFGDWTKFLDKSNRWPLKMLLFCIFTVGTSPQGGGQTEPCVRMLVNADAPRRWQWANTRCHIHPNHTCTTSCFISQNNFFWAFLSLKHVLNIVRILFKMHILPKKWCRFWGIWRNMKKLS